MQEVKVSGFMLSIACRVIWQDGVMFSSQHEAGRRGVVTLLSPCLHSDVIAYDSNPMHRTIWLLLSINNHSFGVVNVYASNDVVERSQMWLTTCHQLLGSCVVTSIWLKWPLTKTAICLFAGQLGKGKPGTTCAINWVFRSQ